MRDPLHILKSVRVTEKGTALAEKHNQYVLKVAPGATKQEIKHAVKQLFQKTAIRINTMQVSGKRKRRHGGHNMGQRSDWKKAIVTLKEGEKIELV
ncbi:MAG TPA: 50S ribosomal protein L23 [Candidatus Methylacidiphilales bacterium]|nr:50S ribosomal protein L23 [Candidatus Methylacidiphilales bacterium]